MICVPIDILNLYMGKCQLNCDEKISIITRHQFKFPVVFTDLSGSHAVVSRLDINAQQQNTQHSFHFNKQLQFSIQNIKYICMINILLYYYASCKAIQTGCYIALKVL